MAPVIIVDLEFVATLRDDTNTTCTSLRGEDGYSARTSSLRARSASTRKQSSARSSP